MNLFRLPLLRGQFGIDSTSISRFDPFSMPHRPLRWGRRGGFEGGAWGPVPKPLTSLEKTSTMLWGAVRIGAATAENRTRFWLHLSEAWGPPQFQEKRSRSEKAILSILHASSCNSLSGTVSAEFCLFCTACVAAMHSRGPHDPCAGLE